MSALLFFAIVLLRMIFDLTDEIQGQVIFSMDDQDNQYAFDSEELKIVPLEEITVDDDRYYRLPEWDSLRGYNLRETFVASLRNPLARQELHAVIFSGHGVFKNFKKVLREYPEVEKQWFSFKKQKMSQIVVEWYNTLSSSWGLEVLDEEPCENADIIHDDFNFKEVSFSRDLEKIQGSEEAYFLELKENQEGETGSVISELSRRLHKSFEKDFSFSLFAETVNGDYAGCIEASLIKEVSSLIAVIKLIYVMPRYRGLGVGRELLAQCMEQLKQKGICRVIAAGAVIPSSAVKLLQTSGFSPLGSGFIANL